MTDTAPTAVPIPGQITLPDGRVELAPGTPPPSGPYANDDLLPVPAARRTWTTYTFSALWVGMAHNTASWTLASGLIAVGMDWRQAVFTIALANLIVLAPMLLTGHAGPKYGIPFPVFARASFGVRGANLPAVVRALVACGWFGIQTWIGGEAIYFLAGKLIGTGWTDAAHIGGHAWTMWLSFALFWALQVAIILRGMETIRRFENWAAPFVLVGAFVMLWWMSDRAGGLGPLFAQPSRLGWGGAFWKLFWPSLMGMIGFWSTLSLNIPDFTRYGKSQRAQTWGQALGLPTTMTLFAFLSVLVTSGSQAVYGEPVWDPVRLAAKTDNAAGLLYALVTVLVATLSVNIAANLVSPAFDFSNVAPGKVSFRTGALITAVLAVLILPWRLYSDPRGYIFTWLGLVGGLLGTVAGILVADYWLLRRTRLDLAALYRAGGRYWYLGGWNPRAVLAFLAGGVLAVGGADFTPLTDGRPIPALSPLADYGWAVGLGTSLVVYLALTRLAPPRPAADRSPGPGRNGRKPAGSRVLSGRMPLGRVRTRLPDHGSGHHGGGRDAHE